MLQAATSVDVRRSSSDSEVLNPMDPWEAASVVQWRLLGERCKFPAPLPPLKEDLLPEISLEDDDIQCFTVEACCGEPPYSAHIFDFRLRRWYSILTYYQNPDAKHPDTDDPYIANIFRGHPQTDDPYWADILRRCGHRCRGDFNRVFVDPKTGALIRSVAPPDHIIGVPLHLKPPPPPPPTIPSIPLAELEQREYLDGLIELATWQKQQVVFKQICLSGDVQRLYRELELNNRLRHSPHVVHVLAYVVDEDSDMQGFLLPFAGRQIDLLEHVRWTHIRDTVYGLRDIHSLLIADNDGREIEASHGDVFGRNILVGDDGTARFIDLGNRGYDYTSDREAMIDVIVGLRKKCESEQDGQRMDEICQMLWKGLSFVEISLAIESW